MIGKHLLERVDGLVDLTGALLSGRQQDCRIDERRLILDNAAQKRHGLVESSGLDIEPGEREVEPDVEAIATSLLERGNRASGIGRRIVALAERQPALGVRGVDRPENPVRLLVGGVPREGCLRVRDRVERVVLARIEARQLGAQFRRPGIEGNRTLMGLDSLLDPALALEMAREEEVVARIALLGTRLRTLARRCGSERKQK